MKKLQSMGTYCKSTGVGNTMVAMSYNGNTFMANQDIMKTFNIKFSSLQHTTSKPTARWNVSIRTSRNPFGLLSSSWVKFTRTSG